MAVELYRYPTENIQKGIDYLHINVVETKFGKSNQVTTANTVYVNSGQKNPSGPGPGGTYPAQLTTTVNTLIKNAGFARNKNRNIKASIILPMPSNITDTNQVNYSDDTLDAVTAEVAGYAGSMMRSSSATEIANKMSAFVTGIGARGDQLKDIYLGQLAASAGQLAGVGNITLNQILARGENQILNPNMELLFNGPTIRNFRFSFKMTPRDENESEHVLGIIRTFKQNMAPKASDKFFLGAPNIFELNYLQTTAKKGEVQYHSFLHKFKQCALTDITINYTGENVYATYADGTPVSIIMDLTFKELEPIYDIDYTSTPEGRHAVGY
jgi:hypothetical protein